jgi:6-phosphogluconolactonase
MTTDTIVVHPDHDSLAAAVAARLITAILDAQSARGGAHIALTGGRIGTSSLAAVVADPARTAVDWSRVDFWWSDERFEPDGDPLRNETDARTAMLDKLPVDPARVHAMPCSGGAFGGDVDAATAGYAAELAAAAGDADGIPRIDVAMLGVGEDGHVASLFPGHPGLQAQGTVIPVRDSPKPPPTRISFTLATIDAAAQVWLIASGEGKAEAIRAALAPGPGTVAVPAGMVRGTSATFALLDADAASLLPR